MDSTSTTTDPGMLLGVLAANAFIFLLAYALGSFLMSLVFKKAGIAMWKAWVPVYNLWTFLEMGGQKGWISLLAVVPVLNVITIWIAIVFIVIAAYRIGLNFGKEGWFVLLYIFLPLVWYIWLAVDKTAVWQPATSAGTVPATPVAQNETFAQTPVQQPPVSQPTPQQPQNDPTQQPPTTM